MTDDPRVRAHDHRSELTTDAGKAAYEAVREVVWYGVKDRFPSSLALVSYVGDQLLKLEALVTPEPSAEDGRPPLAPETVIHDKAYAAGLIRGRELQREADAMRAEPSAEADVALLYNAVVQPDTIWFDDLTPEMQEGWRRGVAALSRPATPPLDVAEVAHKAAQIGFTYGALGRDFEYVYKNVNDMLAALANPDPETGGGHEGAGR